MMYNPPYFGGAIRDAIKGSSWKVQTLLNASESVGICYLDSLMDMVVSRCLWLSYWRDSRGATPGSGYDYRQPGNLLKYTTYKKLVAQLLEGSRSVLECRLT